MAALSLLAASCGVQFYKPAVFAKQYPVEYLFDGEVKLNLISGKFDILRTCHVTGEGLTGWSVRHKQHRTYEYGQIVSILIYPEGKKASRISPGAIPPLVIAGAGLTAATIAAIVAAAACCPYAYVDWGDGATLRADCLTGAMTSSLERSEVSSLGRVPPGAVGGRIEIRAEAQEDEFIDLARVLVAEHPEGTTIASAAGGGLVILGEQSPPFAAADSEGIDVLAQVQGPGDGLEFVSPPRRLEGEAGKGRTALDHLEASFAVPQGAGRALIAIEARVSDLGAVMSYLYGMRMGRPGAGIIDRILRAHPDPRGAATRRMRRDGALVEVSALDSTGGWRRIGWLDPAGAAAWKTQAIEVDLADLPPGVLTVRLGMAAAMWRIDAIGADFSDRQAPSIVEATAASLTGPGGTDASSVLAESDGERLAIPQGGKATIDFDLPPQSSPATQVRTLLLEIGGYYVPMFDEEPGIDEVIDLAMHGVEEPLGAFTLRKVRSMGLAKAWGI